VASLIAVTDAADVDIDSVMGFAVFEVAICSLGQWQYSSAADASAWTNLPADGSIKKGHALQLESTSSIRFSAYTVRCALLTIDSAALGLGPSGCGCCTVRVFRQKFTLEDAVGSHACSLEALPCVCPMAFLSGVHYLLPVGTVNCVPTLKATTTLTATLTLTLTLTLTQPCKLRPNTEGNLLECKYTTDHELCRHLAE
jgi:hypothetical protein